MKGFKLVSGDVSVVNNQIEMIDGQELTRQTVEQVLNTNKGEWVLNEDEGINFHNILGKHTGKPKEQNNALKSHYNNEINKIKESENELAKRLEERLEGR